jgi:RNA polymerase sigma factor (sigma-70 family)
MSGQATDLWRHVYGLAGNRAASEWTDGELLERFRARREEAAFAALVERHGPLVLRVCRRILRDPGAAEDAFQATFLVLARKAASVGRRERLAGWLRGVAARIALHACADMARRADREARVPSRIPADPLAEVSGRELCEALEEEVQRLPERLRGPVCLCFLEGRTRDEAARQLGWSLRTLQRRLGQARKLLQVRLSRRGLTLAAALLAAEVTRPAVQAVPALLVCTTTRAVGRFALGPCAGGAAPTPAVALARRFLQTTAAARARLAAAVLLAAGLVGGGTALLAGHSRPAQPPPAQSEAPPTPAKQPTPAPRVKARQDAFGDPLPPHALIRLGTLRWRTNAAYLAFLADGKTLVTADRFPGSTVRLWDAATGQERRRFALPRKFLASITLSPDGRTLALNYMNEPDARAIALGDLGGPVVLWDAATGKEVRQLDARQMALGLAFSPSGKLLAGACYDKVIRLWDTTTGALVRAITGHGIYVKEVTFSPDGRLLAGAGHDKTIRLWGVRTGKEQAKLVGHTEVPSALAFSADGKLLASASARDASARIWDVATGKEVRKLTGLRGSPHCLAFSPDGKVLATGTADATQAAVQLWAPETGEELHRREGPWAWVVALAFSPDGQVLASAGTDNTIRLWDAATARETRAPGGLPGVVQRVAFSADGKSLYTQCVDQQLQEWDAERGTLQRRLVVREEGPHRGSATFSPDRRLLATPGWNDNVVRLWDMSTGKMLRSLEGHRTPPWNVTFSDDGRLLASAGSDKTVFIWETATGKERRRIADQPGQVRCVAFAPDGRVLAGAVTPSAQEALIKLWDVGTGKELRSWSVNQLPNDLRFSPDGRYLAFSGRRAGSPPVPGAAIILWDVAAGREYCRFVLPDARENGRLAFSPDGRALASANGDGLIRLWEVATARERGRFSGHKVGTTDLTFSPDGTRLASGGLDTTALIWDVTGLADEVKPVRLSPAEAAALWDDLADADAVKAHRAVWKLTAAPAEALALLAKKLRPAEADEPRVDRLIAELDGADFDRRRKAARELERLGEQAEAALRKALAGTASAEMRRRVKQLLAKLEGPAVAPKTLRAVRAVEVLEHLGTPEARRLLRALAQGAPSARLTREARGSLGRLGRRPPGATPGAPPGPAARPGNSPR